MTLRVEGTRCVAAYMTPKREANYIMIIALQGLPKDKNE